MTRRVWEDDEDDDYPFDDFGDELELDDPEHPFDDEDEDDDDDEIDSDDDEDGFGE